jgi:hypothetical protein
MLITDRNQVQRFGILLRICVETGWGLFRFVSFFSQSNKSTACGMNEVGRDKTRNRCYLEVIVVSFQVLQDRF